jgi:hypothetical protein
MLRTPLIAALALAALAPAAQAKARPQALVAACDRIHQAAVFEGHMDAVSGADRMQMRFRLQVSTPDAPVWENVTVPGFTAWVTSDPGRTRYVYDKRVESLLAPASYRVRMRFRWLDAQGVVLQTSHDVSLTCRQPDPRADLRVIGLSAAPGVDASERRYAVAIRNAGRTAAPASTVRLELPDGRALTASVPPIAAAGREDVFLSGPPCRQGDLLIVTADADDAVDERDEANVLMLPCPSG